MYTACVYPKSLLKAHLILTSLSFYSFFTNLVCWGEVQERQFKNWASAVD